MDDIPLLEDIVTESNGHHSNDVQSHKTDPSQHLRSQPKSANERKENPFLPYEHLARLALEREQFTQSIEAFTENLKHERPYHQRTPAARKRTFSNKDDAIVQAITNRILDQLTPIIEDQVATELNAYFKTEAENH